MNKELPRFTKTFTRHETTVDTTTGLEWQATPFTNSMTHEQAEKACRELRLGGHSDWRLPTRAELLTLVDITKHEPSIDTDAFPDFPSRWFWSSDLCAWSSASAWYVNFSNGYVYHGLRASYGFALAVRRASQ
jgi:hypothetical protein